MAEAAGERALRGEKEHFNGWLFPAARYDRKIWFTGYWITIYHEITKDKIVDVHNVVGKEFDVPKDYICEVVTGTAQFTEA